jgi:hypothetical protein
MIGVRICTQCQLGTHDHCVCTDCEVCAHRFEKEALAAAKKVLEQANEEIKALRKVLKIQEDLAESLHTVAQDTEDRLEKALYWEDTSDLWSKPIAEAFPSRSESHEEYATAMEMVGHRHSKGQLVALVNWLLVTKTKLEDERDNSYAKGAEDAASSIDEYALRIAKEIEEMMITRPEDDHADAVYAALDKLRNLVAQLPRSNQQGK